MQFNFITFPKSSFTIIAFFLIIVSNAQNHKIIKTKSESDLIPEGIAVDSRSGTIYVSSINKHKIIAIDKNGNHRDFIKSNQDGFLEGLGMKVDAKRNLLWAISVTTAPKAYTSHVHAFNTKSGRQVQVYTLTDTVPHMFNDLDIDEKGNVYVSDTYSSAIYFIDTKKKKLELFLKVPEIQYPNGISVANNNQLYVTTYANGLAKIDRATKKAIVLKGYKDSALIRGLDGLAFSKNSLIAVNNYNPKKNGFDTAVVIKYVLNPAGDEIIREEIIDKGNPQFFQPTTLALANRKLFVLANSHLHIYNTNKQSTKGKEDLLTPVSIVVYQF